MTRTWQRLVAGTFAAFAFGAGVGAGGAAVYLGWTRHTHPATEPGTAATAYATVQPTPSTLPLGPDTIAQVAARASRAVVKITATIIVKAANPFNPFFNQFFSSLFGNGPFSMPMPPLPTGPVYETETALGSGFFFNPAGYILTNDHVVQGARRILVTVMGYPKPFSARIVGEDYAADLAVLKIQAPRPLPVLPLGNSNATPVGAWVVAIGNPYGLSDTVTEGVISAKGRPLTIGQRHYRNLLQTSAAINPGNSGGPLLNLAGQVVGINTAVAEQAQGIGFAIPTSTVEAVLPKLLGHQLLGRPWTGVLATSDSAQLARRFHLSARSGAVVADVAPNSPAARAGLHRGDVIVGVDGHRITSSWAFRRWVRDARPGDHLSLTVAGRDGVRHVVVAVGTAPPITASP